MNEKKKDEQLRESLYLVDYCQNTKMSMNKQILLICLMTATKVNHWMKRGSNRRFKLAVVVVGCGDTLQ